ncbi:hypothetical protein OSB04_031424 [Centaurea solstitialis]|uniref:Integrase catalytic domain-containing protein n=1 Tax=Centaurea solstitialis TaxID=347529 RepID=A0AA38SLM7_9ASTR|nr:hypothetical protein OSB04_031424 [Centaurea solstitialis]
MAQNQTNVVSTASSDTDPFFLHHSDNTGLVLVSQPLNSENYLSWSRSMIIALSVKNKIGFIDGSLVRPDGTNQQKLNAWIRNNHIVISWILNTLSKEISPSVMYRDTAKEMWEELKERFSQGSSPRIYEIRREIVSLAQDQDSVSVYFTKLKGLSEELANYRPHCTCLKCDCGGLKDIEAYLQNEQKMNFLMGLNDSFSQIRGQILLMEPMPPINKIFSLVAQEEKQRSVSSVGKNIPSVAYQVNTSKGGYQSRFGANKQRPYCTHCKIQGHTMEKCYKIHGYPPGYKTNNKYAPRNAVSNLVQEMSPAECERLMAILSNRMTDVNAATNEQVFQVQGIYHALSFQMRNLSSTFWILDSGASKHICCDRRLFLKIHHIQDSNVRLPNGVLIPVSGIGNVRINNILLLEDVLFVPQFHLNLLSIGQLTSLGKYRVVFDEGIAIVQDARTRKMIGTVKMIQGLYALKIEDSCRSNAAINLASVETWHRRLGHPSSDVLDALHSVLATNKHSLANNNDPCMVCPLAKQKRLPFVSLNNMSKEAFDLIHCDVWGPFHTHSYQGHRFFLTIVDDYSRFTWVYMLKHKSEVTVLIPQFYAMIQTQFGKGIRSVRSDNAKEFDFSQFFADKGVISQKSCVERPEQNSVVERKHQHILNVARALFFQSKIPLAYWSECVRTAIFLINRIPSKLLNNKTPYELMYGKIPDYSTIRVFGCLSFASTLPSSRHKFSPRAVPCVLIGFPSHMKAYKLFDLQSKRCFYSRDVFFHEKVFPFDKSIDVPLHDPFKDVVIPVAPRDDDLPNNDNDVSLSPTTSNASPETLNDEPVQIRKSSRQHKPPSYLRDFHCNSVSDKVSLPRYALANVLSYEQLSSSFKAFTASVSSNTEPRSYSEAVKQKEWVLAMEQELQAMKDNNTWSIVSLPPGKNVVGCRWVYKVKLKADGTIERYKARLVAKGFTQQEGVDYLETYSPVAKPATIKTMLALAAIQDWRLVQLDVNNAFLHGDLDEEVYMKIPQGLSIKGASDLVCKLHKSIYGLKQSSRQWYAKFSNFLMNIGFIQSKADYSLFYKGSGSTYVAVLVYVDDIILAGPSQNLIDEVKIQLSNTFKLKDLGDLKYFLGLEVARSKRGIFVSQRHYALQLLEDMGLLAAKPANTPMVSHLYHSTDSGKLMDDPSKFRRLIGRLLYLNFTRPDISFTVNKLSQFLASPTEVHWQAAIHLLKYVKKQPGQGIFLSAESSTQIRAFCDSDYGMCLDTRRSTTGFCVFVGDSLISWKSKRQSVVSRSSTEAEYRAMAITTTELVWMRQLLKDFDVAVTDPTLLFCDNKSALDLASNPTFHERTKHIEIDCHYVREKVMDKTIKLLPIRSHLQLADMFTKALPLCKMKPLMSKMALHNIYCARPS